MKNAPTTLIEAITYFSDEQVAHDFVASLRWKDGAECPACDSKNVGFLSTRSVWKCRDCKKQFSIKVGTIFEGSPISLSKWLPAMWLIVNCKNGVSSYELARAIKVTQKTAWFMLHRIRLAMQSGDFLLSGEVEVDETFIRRSAPPSSRAPASTPTHSRPTTASKRSTSTASSTTRPSTSGGTPTPTASRTSGAS